MRLRGDGGHRVSSRKSGSASRSIGQDMQRGPPRPRPSSKPAIVITSMPSRRSRCRPLHAHPVSGAGAFWTSERSRRSASGNPQRSPLTATRARRGVQRVVVARPCRPPTARPGARAGRVTRVGVHAHRVDDASWTVVRLSPAVRGGDAAAGVASGWRGVAVGMSAPPQFAHCLGSCSTGVVAGTNHFMPQSGQRKCRCMVASSSSDRLPTTVERRTVDVGLRTGWAVHAASRP
jgi:hypothetical protein